MWKKFRNWHSGLSKAGKVILWSVTAVLAGTAIHAGASSSNPNKPIPKTTVPPHTPVINKPPTITKKIVTETSTIAFSKTTLEDASLAKGKSEIRTSGVDGVKTSTYEITYTDGKQTDKKLTKEETTRQPVTEVTAIGTYVAPAPKPNCDPNYSGACVPNVYPSDVDCAGGSGNGPYYVQGPVYVIGTDRYGLDANHDGIACQ